MKACIRWIQDAMFVGETDSSHAVIMDGPAERGGRNMGIRPMEMILLGLGGCSASDVVHILRKARQEVSGCVTELQAERAENPPKVFTRIHLRFVVSGRDLNEKHVRRAVDLSAEKYCSASIMLGKSVAITHDYEIRDA